MASVSVRPRRRRARRHGIRCRAHGELPRVRGTRDGLERALKTCPECGREVRPVWPTCKSCGTLLMARPEPLTPVGAPAATAGATTGATAAPPRGATAPTAPTAPSEAEQFFAPTVLQPITQLPPASLPSSSSSYGSAGTARVAPRDTVDAGKWIKLGGIVLFLIAAIATAYVTFGSAAKKHQAPVVLAPKAPTNGLPTSLETIVRMEAESSRRNALQAVEQVGSGDVARLAAMQPNYTYIGGDQASKDPHTVSVLQNDSTIVTIAVSASNKDICAYGRWAQGGTPVYVTMAHEPSCSAATAPATGWSTEAGGAASDLPDDNLG
jgi:hypothetical protein